VNAPNKSLDRSDDIADCRFPIADLKSRRHVNSDVGRIAIRTASGSDPIKTQVRDDPIATAPASDTPGGACAQTNVMSDE